MLLLDVALFVVGLGQSPQGLAPRVRAGDVRVMTYNIKHGQTNAACTQPAAMPGQPPAPDCNLDLQAAIAVIREHDPDIVGLQEIDRFWARSAYQDEPAVLSAALGLEHRCYAANLDHPADNHADRPHQYGTLVLSRFPIRTCGNTPLPRNGENEQRGLAGAVIDVRGVPLQVYNTHLHTTAADRLLQTEAIAQAIDAASAGAKVMVGDFNARPTARELQPLLARFTDAWSMAATAAADNLDGLTSPAELDGSPRSRIDYVLVSAPTNVGAAYVPIDARTRLASDHYPVVVDLTLAATQAGPAPTLVGVAKVRDAGAHAAFTDLIRWRNRWYCTFCESDAHIGGSGRIRVLTSTDGKAWTSAALIAETAAEWTATLVSSRDGRTFQEVRRSRCRTGRTRQPDDRRSRRTLDSGYEPVPTLPSGGDTGYPGTVWHDGLLWVSYNASHEGKSAIHLAHVKPGN